MEPWNLLVVTGCLPVPPLARQGSLNALKSVKEQNPQGPEGQEDADRLSTRGQSRVPCWGAKGRPQIFPETSSGSGSQEVPLKHSLLSNEHAPWALTARELRASCSRTLRPRDRGRWRPVRRRLPTRRGLRGGNRLAGSLGESGAWPRPGLGSPLCCPLPHFTRGEKPLTCPANNPQTPIIHRMLNTAEPTMVPTPTSPWVMNTPAKEKAQFLTCKARLAGPQAQAG